MKEKDNERHKKEDKYSLFSLKETKKIRELEYQTKENTSVSINKERRERERKREENRYNIYSTIQGHKDFVFKFLRSSLISCVERCLTHRQMNIINISNSFNSC